MSKSSGSFFLQAEDGIRDLERSRGLGDVYERQGLANCFMERFLLIARTTTCFLYTSDAADDLTRVGF